MAVHFQNNQWAVDDTGLVAVKPGAPYKYAIGANRLLEMAGAGGGKLYDWPIQVITKTWVDIDAFLEAYEKAIEIHKGKYEGEVDRDLMAKSIMAARQTKA